MNKKSQTTVTRGDFLKGFSGSALGAAVGPKLLAQDAASLHTSEEDIPVFKKKTISPAVNGRLAQVTVVSPRILFGGVAPVPWRSGRAEELIGGVSLTEESAHRAASGALKTARSLGENAYKIALAETTTARALLSLLQ